MEGIVNFFPNVESFLLTSGSRRWYVVGAYMPPHDEASCLSHQAGVGDGAKANGGNHVGELQRKADGIAGRQVGRAHVGTGGKWAGRCDSPFHAKAAVLRDRELELTDES